MFDVLQLQWLKKKRFEEKMPAGKDRRKEEPVEEAVPSSSEDEYTEVSEEEAPAVPESARAGKAAGLAPTPKHTAGRREVDLESSESEDYPRPKPKSPERPPRVYRGRADTEGRSCAKKNSSSSPERPMSSKGSIKGGKGRKGFQRCEHCWGKVSTLSKNALAQHQMWNHGCVTWQYHNKGVGWAEAQGKALRKIERRQQRSWAQQEAEARGAETEKKGAEAEKKGAEGEKKKKKKKELRRSPTPEARGPKKDRHHRRDPDTDSEDREGRHPKLRRRDDRTFILTMPKAR